MLSTKVIEHCRVNGWWHEDVPVEYEEALRKLNVDLNSDFAQFYLHAEDGPTFYSRHQELYQICWVIENTVYLDDMNIAQLTLGLPEAYIPLDSFEGEGGFFYNRQTDEVVLVELGESIERFLSGESKPQWADFNAFLEWYFELAEVTTL
ncbi:SMI1/KNR4 family protein [Paenibacillus sp. TC-CSREp1]|uniref:SMI1/KNR4 family protein n=1 Tax=Paenibacillus sp. TC-CSREp1 TaxID=3410089 RepID=UPI003D015C91